MTGVAAALLLMGCADSKDAVLEPVPDHPARISDKYAYVSGRQIMNPDSTTLSVRGVSLDGWLSPDPAVLGFPASLSGWQTDLALKQWCGPVKAGQFWQDFVANFISESDIQLIAGKGFNTVRVPLDYRWFTKEDFMGETSDKDCYQILDRLFKWCKSSNLYVILDMKSAPGGQSEDGGDNGYGYPWLMTGRHYQTEFIKTWTSIATRYSEEKQLLGYELVDAPLASPDYTEAYASSALEPLYVRTIKALRTVDANHIVILDGAQGAPDFSHFSHFDATDNIVYACQATDVADISQKVQDYVSFRETVSGWPMLMTRIALGEDNTESGQIAAASADKGIGYIVGPYKSAGKASLSRVTPPGGWDALVSFTKADRSSYASLYGAAKNRDATTNILSGFANATILDKCVWQDDHAKSVVK